MALFCATAFSYHGGRRVCLVRLSGRIKSLVIIVLPVVFPSALDVVRVYILGEFGHVFAKLIVVKVVLLFVLLVVVFSLVVIVVFVHFLNTSIKNTPVLNYRPMNIWTKIFPYFGL